MGRVAAILLFLFLLGVHSTFSQSEAGLLGLINFDSCTVSEVSRKFTPSSVGPIDCECGVSNRSLVLNGGLNFVQWDAPSLQSIFENDFTVSFYFKPDGNATGVQDILSKRSKCGIDSMFAIRYLADQRTIAADIVGRVDNMTSLNAKLPDNFCWYFVAFTKQGQRISLYINGEEKAFKLNNFTIQVKNNAKVALANSPCLGVTDTRFKGNIDELKFYNRALSKDQIKSQYKIIDKLITNDTIILSGSSVTTRVHPSCASSFRWIPVAGVADATKQSTVITPARSGAYTLITDYGNCMIRDTINITVVEKGSLDCNSVQIPNAFTPNDDGLNDLFRITNHYVLPPQLSFEVFDRWGAKVFSGNSNISAWDGTFNGKEMNPGIFVYHIKYNCNGSNKHKSGSFKLIR